MVEMRTGPSQKIKSGELLVKEGLVHEKDIAAALEIQKKRKASPALEKGKLLGMILCDLNLITPVDNYTVLHKNNRLFTLSSALVDKKIVSLEQMRALEARSLREDLPLISLLLKTNTTSLPVLQQLLFNLFHIPFRSISDFIFNPEDQKVLTRIMARPVSKENGVIPMVYKDNTILFGMTAPENVLLIHQLNRTYPQYRFKAIFIPYSAFRWFHDIIYRKKPEKGDEKKESKKPDLSLLLNYKALIKAPEKEKAAIRTLYRQYETIRTLLGHEAVEGRSKAFFEFIHQAHHSMTQRSKARKIEYAFEKQGRDIIIMAQPKE